MRQAALTAAAIAASESKRARWPDLKEIEARQAGLPAGQPLRRRRPGRQDRPGQGGLRGGPEPRQADHQGRGHPHRRDPVRDHRQQRGAPRLRRPPPGPPVGPRDGRGERQARLRRRQRRRPGRHDVLHDRRHTPPRTSASNAAKEAIILLSAVDPVPGDQPVVLVQHQLRRHGPRGGGPPARGRRATGRRPRSCGTSWGRWWRAPR